MTQSPDLDDSFLDEPFHGAAWAAFAELYRETGGLPDSEETRLRAYQIYEEELARKNQVKTITGKEAP